VFIDGSSFIFNGTNYKHEIYNPTFIGTVIRATSGNANYSAFYIQGPYAERTKILNTVWREIGYPGQLDIYATNSPSLQIEEIGAVSPLPYALTQISCNSSTNSYAPNMDRYKIHAVTFTDASASGSASLTI